MSDMTPNSLLGKWRVPWAGGLVTALMLLQTVSAAAWGPAPYGGLQPSLSQDCTTQLSIETPSAGSSVAGNMTVSGWAVDLTSPSGSGIDAVRLYWDAPSEEGGVGLGVATIGLPRADVDASLGLSGSNAGWELPVDFSALPAGWHTLYAYARSLCGWTYIAQDVYIEPTAAAAPAPAPAAPAVTAPAAAPAAAPSAFSQPVVRIESPTAGSSLTANQQVTGFAVDCSTGRPATSVKVYAGPGSSNLLGNATVGTSSRDLSAMCGTGRTGTANAGFSFQLNPSLLQPGIQTITVIADTGSATATSSVALNVGGGATAGAAGQTAGASGYGSTTGYNTQTGYNAQTGYNTQTGQSTNPFALNQTNPSMAGAAGLGSGCPVGSTYSPTASGCANVPGTAGANINPNQYANAQNINPALLNPNLYAGQTQQYNTTSGCPTGSVLSGNQCIPNTSYYASGVGAQYPYGMVYPYGSAYGYGNTGYPYNSTYYNSGYPYNSTYYGNTGYYGSTGYYGNLYPYGTSYSGSNYPYGTGYYGNTYPYGTSYYGSNYPYGSIYGGNTYGYPYGYSGYGAYGGYNLYGGGYPYGYPRY